MLALLRRTVCRGRSRIRVHSSRKSRWFSQARIHSRRAAYDSPKTSIPPIRVKQDEISITYNSKLLFIGSCFSEVMARKLSDLKFDAKVNPAHGILFNPVSIAQGVSRICNREHYLLEDVKKSSIHKDIYHSWDHHSYFSSTDPQTMLHSINSTLDIAHDYLSQCQTLFVTLGSAKVHYLSPPEFNVPERVVANCHKEPSKLFCNRYLSVEEVDNSLFKTIKAVRMINPDAQIVFTVSPVRHLREGVIENALSKSTLLCAVHSLLERQKKCNATKMRRAETLQYFPSYEIMIDELRDYRYYKEDFVHPSDLAEDIIFSRFMDAFVLEKEVQSLCDSVKHIVKGLNHKPQHLTSQAHKSHLLMIHKRICDIGTRVDLSVEKEFIASSLRHNFDRQI